MNDAVGRVHKPTMRVGRIDRTKSELRAMRMKRIRELFTVTSGYVGSCTLKICFQIIIRAFFPAATTSSRSNNDLLSSPHDLLDLFKNVDRTANVASSVSLAFAYSTLLKEDNGRKGDGGRRRERKGPVVLRKRRRGEEP